MKEIFFLRFCLCIFESDTVKIDCPVQIFRKIQYRLLVCLTSFTVFSGDIKKKNNSENDQLTGHFQSLFNYFFFVPPTLNLKNNSRKSTNKKILA